MTDPQDTQTLAHRERSELCALFDSVGPDSPTLCTGWLAVDLLAHLVIREGHPAAVGIAVAPLARWNAHVHRQLIKRPFDDLVNRLRKGPPLYSPMRPTRLDASLNTFEFFVHHEDVRRAQSSWTPRTLRDKDRRLLWNLLATRGRVFVRRSPLGVTLQDGQGQQLTLGGERPAITLTGDPGELVLYLHGRQSHARVEISGDADDVDQFQRVNLGV